MSRHKHHGDTARTFGYINPYKEAQLTRGGHSFIEPTPTSLAREAVERGVQPEASNDGAASETSEASPTRRRITRPKRNRNTSEIDPRIKGGLIGRTALGTPFDDIQNHLAGLARSANVSFEPPEGRQLAFVHATAGQLIGQVGKSIAYRAGYLASRLEALYDEGIVDNALGRSEFSINVTAASPLTLVTRLAGIKADLVAVRAILPYTELTGEQRSVRGGLGLEVGERQPHATIGFMKGMNLAAATEFIQNVQEDPVPQDTIITLGRLTVLPKSGIAPGQTSYDRIINI